MTRIGNFFKKIGRGIKKGAKAAYGFGKKVVKKVSETEEDDEEEDDDYDDDDEDDER